MTAPESGKTPQDPKQHELPFGPQAGEAGEQFELPFDAKEAAAENAHETTEEATAAKAMVEEIQALTPAEAAHYDWIKEQMGEASEKPKKEEEPENNPGIDWSKVSGEKKTEAVQTSASASHNEGGVMNEAPAIDWNAVSQDAPKSEAVMNEAPGIDWSRMNERRNATQETSPNSQEATQPPRERLRTVREFIRTNTDTLRRFGVSILMARVLGNWAAIPRLYDVVKYFKQRNIVRGKNGIDASVIGMMEGREQNAANRTPGRRQERMNQLGELLGRAWETDDPQALEAIMNEAASIQAESPVRDNIRRLNEQLKSTRGGEKRVSMREVRDAEGNRVPVLGPDGQPVMDEFGNQQYQVERVVETSPERQMYAKFLRDLRNQTNMTQEQRAAFIRDFNDRYVDTKITGIQAAKQALNSTLMLSTLAFPGVARPVAGVGRLATFAVADVAAHRRRMDQESMQRYMAVSEQVRAARRAGNQAEVQRLTQEQDMLRTESRNMPSIRDALVDSVQHTYRSIRGTQPNLTRLQRWGAVAKVATYLGLGFSAYESYVHSNDHISDALKGLKEKMEERHTVAGSDTGPSLFERIKQTVEAAKHSNTEAPKPDADPEAWRHHEFQGGRSIWAEAGKQVESRFHTNIDQVTRDFQGNQAAIDAVKTYNVDRMKDLITLDPEKYGLPKGINVDRITLEQLKGIKWDDVARDAFPRDHGFEIPSKTEILSIEHNNAEVHAFFESHPNVPITGENIDKVIRGDGAGLEASLATDHADVPSVEAAATMDHAALAEAVHPIEAASPDSDAIGDVVQLEMQRDIAHALNGSTEDQVRLYEKFGLAPNDHDHFMDIFHKYRGESGNDATKFTQLQEGEAAKAVRELAAMKDPAKIEELSSVVVPQEGRRMVEFTSDIMKKLAREFPGQTNDLKEKFGANSSRELGVIVRAYMNEHRGENLSTHDAIQRLVDAKPAEAQEIVASIGGNAEVKAVAEHLKTLQEGTATPAATEAAQKIVEQLPASEAEFNALPATEQLNVKKWIDIAKYFHLEPGGRVVAQQYGVYHDVEAHLDGNNTLWFRHDGGLEKIQQPSEKILDMPWVKQMSAEARADYRTYFDNQVRALQITPGGEISKDNFLGESHIEAQYDTDGNLRIIHDNGNIEFLMKPAP